MIIFVARRLAQAIPVMFLATIGVFLLLHLLPGDPAALMAGSDAPQATIEFVRHDMGLDQPLPVQYVIWLGHVARGDLGKSVFSKLPVSQLIGQRAPATIELAIAGELLTLLIALPLGVTAAVKQRTPLDWLISSSTSIGLAIPNFWLGILLILLFAVALGWLPPGQRGDLLRDPVAELKFLALPAFTLALPLAMNLSPADQSLGARSVVRGPRPHRTRERAGRSGGNHRTRAAQCAGADRDRDQSRYWPTAWRRTYCRNDLRLARIGHAHARSRWQS
jgi:peptide/nickel transport system permease protein